MKFAKTVLSTLSAAALGLMALGLTAAPVQAATTTTTFGVSATVLSTCGVSVGSLGFGSYDPTAATALASTSTITVTCTPGLTPTFVLSGGLTGTVAARVMKSGAVSLNYGLYSDASHTLNFGLTATSITSGTPITIYGQVPTGQYVAANTYNDTVTATVTY